MNEKYVESKEKGLISDDYTFNQFVAACTHINPKRGETIAKKKNDNRDIRNMLTSKSKYSLTDFGTILQWVVLQNIKRSKLRNNEFKQVSDKNPTLRKFDPEFYHQDYLVHCYHKIMAVVLL